MSARTAFILTGLLIGGAASLPAQAATPAVIPASTALPEMVLDSGQASWYGPRHVGLRTFNGERFDPRRMTAAHASLPMGTMVRVTDMATGRSVIVRVNDREPPHGLRCIDLSEGAATMLGIHGRGLADVTLTAVGAAALPRAEETVEVAEAPDSASALQARPGHALSPSGLMGQVRAPHGHQHKHRAAR